MHILHRNFFACVGTHFFVRFRPPWVKLDHFCAMQNKSRQDNARRQCSTNARQVCSTSARWPLDHRALDHLLVGLSGVSSISFTVQNVAFEQFFAAKRNLCIMHMHLCITYTEEYIGFFVIGVFLCNMLNVPVPLSIALTNRIWELCNIFMLPY